MCRIISGIISRSSILNEKKIDSKGYGRIYGNYRNIVMFDPRFMCVCVLHKLIGDTIPTVLTTMDGFILNHCFIEDFKNEPEKMLKFFSDKKGELTEMDLERFYKSVSNSSFRDLYQKASSKQRYLPSKNVVGNIKNRECLI